MLSMLRGAADVNTTASLQVAVDLVYTIAAPCDSVTVLASSSDALTTSLLPASAVFRGKMQITKAASNDGCTLDLTINGTISATATDFQDAFDVARYVHQQVMERLSSKDLKNVALTQATMALDGNKLLTVSLMAEDSDAASGSVLTVQKGACKELLDTLQGEKDNDMLLPRNVETSTLKITKLTDEDETANCVVALNISALVPRINADAEAFQLLKTVDEKMETFFAGRSIAALASANVRLQIKSTEESMALNYAVKKGSVNTASSTNMTLNLPSSEEALGIFALLAMLVAMMMGVVVLKKRNDRRSRERYERANQAAQIRRVSIRMSKYDQNEDQDYEGEEDTLL
ncbi:hypothetical protein KXD40_001809 [Peronospora effusa]|nr:hypothetical protein KXD40_001809 [Peronospora effusa]CAI5704812.1 unnamed protein product [Peronospora effusa]